MWRWWHPQRPHWRWQKGHWHLGTGAPCRTPWLGRFGNPSGVGFFLGGGKEMAGGPCPRSGGHWLCPTRGHRQQTGRGHSSALPWSRPGVGQQGQLPPHTPSTAPRDGAGWGERPYRHLRVLYIYTCRRDPPRPPALPRVWGGSGVPWGQAGRCSQGYGSAVGQPPPRPPSPELAAVG